jgi:hypothetical protein
MPTGGTAGPLPQLRAATPGPAAQRHSKQQRGRRTCRPARLLHHLLAAVRLALVAQLPARGARRGGGCGCGCAVRLVAQLGGAADAAAGGRGLVVHVHQRLALGLRGRRVVAVWVAWWRGAGGGRGQGWRVWGAGARGCGAGCGSCIAARAGCSASTAAGGSRGQQGAAGGSCCAPPTWRARGCSRRRVPGPWRRAGPGPGCEQAPAAVARLASPAAPGTGGAGTAGRWGGPRGRPPAATCERGPGRPVRQRSASRAGPEPASRQAGSGGLAAAQPPPPAAHLRKASAWGDILCA